MVKLSRASMPGSFFFDWLLAVGSQGSGFGAILQGRSARLGNLASDGRTPYLFRTYG